MKGIRALLFGGVFGGAIAIIALFLNISKISLIFFTLATLCGFCLSSIFVFSLCGWPKKKIFQFDAYDCFRVVLGSALAILTVCFMLSVISKVSYTFEIDYILATVIALTAFLSYLLGFFLFIDFLKKQQQQPFVAPYRSQRR